VIGGIAWVTLFTFGGYFFGELPFVKNNFSFVVLAIIFISVLPGVIEFLRERKRNKQIAQQAESLKIDG
jgi:membrane-associated protein